MPDIILPQLRQDILLKPMDTDDDGYPTWVLYDDVSHRYFLIGWLEYEIIIRLKLGTVKKIVEAIHAETTLTITEKNVDIILKFLITNELLQITNEQQVQYLVNKIPKKNYLNQFLKTYLFFMIPLFNPDQFLNKTIKYVRPLFSHYTLIVLAIFGILGIYFVGQQWEEYIGTFNYLFNLSNLILFGIVVIFVKVLHELGHAYTAKYFGCKVSTIGVAFIVLWPIMYTDTTDAWKLTKKYQRAAIDSAGIFVDLAVAIIAIFLWSFVPEGLPKYTLFFISAVSLASSLLINLNPLLRYNGYYLFSDLVNVINLQNTAFPIARWKLREWLFKFGEPPPITYPKKKETLLLIYAYFTWIYRFFLFLAVALVVYVYCFKVLGIILMLVEIVFLIIFPILNELKNYWVRRKNITMNTNSVLTFSIVGILIIFFFVPWSSTVKGPATLSYVDQTKIYNQFSGAIEQINFTSGMPVTKGQLILSLKNYNLDYNITEAHIDIQTIKLKLNAETDKAATLGFKSTTQQELQSKENTLQSLLEEKKKLKLYAPFSGIIFSNNPGFHQGVWLDKNTLIGELVNSTQPVIYAYVSENDLQRISVGAVTKFYPDQKDAEALALKVTAIDTTATDILDLPYLASIYGGKIAVIANKAGELQVQRALYRVKLQPDEKLPAFYHVITGVVQINGKRESYFNQLIKLVSATLIKESGF